VPDAGWNTDIVTAYQIYANASIEDSNATWANTKTDPPISENDTLWWRCCGASVSVPSENLGFYFSGLIAQSGGAINMASGPGDPTQPNTLAKDLIMCSTASLREPRCESISLPNSVQPRAEAELLWIPIGMKGILVLLGGIQMPSDLLSSGVYPNETYANDFMNQISLFDIASREWYVQETLESGDRPSQLAAFCAVAAEGSSRDSWYIYAYGGYDGTYMENPEAFDAVWVLSIPAFQWTMVSEGTGNHRRQSHRCVKPYPDQMISIGGVIEYGQSLVEPGSFFDVFSLTELTWNSTYDPTVWSEYSVPPSITTQIGGDEKGSPAVPPGLNPQLAAILEQPYLRRSQIPKYYPFAKQSLKDSLRRKGLTRWLAIITAIIAYLILSSFVLIAIVVIRRRMSFQHYDVPETEIKSKQWIVKWMHNATMPQKIQHKRGKGDDSTLLHTSYEDDETEPKYNESDLNMTKGTAFGTSERSLVDDTNAVELVPLANKARATTMP